MRPAILLGSIAAFALCCEAQIAASLDRLPNGVEEVKIRNDSRLELVAFAITVKRMARNNQPAASLLICSDPLIDASTAPLRPGEERVLFADGRARDHVRLSGPTLDGLIVAAGILADGTTTGDQGLLARFVLRRRNMLQAVETALETLSDAGKTNMPRRQLVQEFKRLANSVSHWYLPPEQQVGSTLYSSLAAKLATLPEGPLGSPFPPTDFIERETTALNRQRVALLQSEPALAEPVYEK